MKRTLEPEYMDTDDEADGYAAMDHSVPNTAFVERLAELGAAQVKRFVDLGCGPGHIPIMVAERFEQCEVVGVDAAAKMLAYAERFAATSPACERLQFQQLDAKTMDFENASFSGVYSNTVLHHIPDPVPFLREAYRILKPGGLLLIRDLFRPETPQIADELVELYDRDSTPAQQELFRASLHAALTTTELEEAARAAGLSGFEVSVDSDRHHSLQIRYGADSA